MWSDQTSVVVTQRYALVVDRTRLDIYMCKISRRSPETLFLLFPSRRKTI